MNEALRYPDADLRVRPPRGARERLGGLVFLARTIDKARAKLQGTLGLYQLTPGISAYLFAELGIDEAAFLAAVERASDDAEIVAWVRANSDPERYPAINEMLERRAIRDEEHFRSVLPRYPILREQPQLRNWFEIFDLDDVYTFAPRP